MNLNHVILVGRITKDPELRTTPSGMSVSGVGMATNRVWTDKAGQKQEEVEFHNIVFWGRQAEIASQFLKKGALALIEGHLKTREWTDKQGGKRKTTDIICERLQLGPRPSNGTTTEAYVPKTQKPTGLPSLEENSEEIPVIDLESGGEIKPEDIPF